MESVVIEVALYAVAVGTWVWLARVADCDLRVVIRAQQHLGLYTRRPLYRMSGRGRWLLACGAIGAVAGLAAGVGLATAVVLLAVAVGLLAYVYVAASGLLNPRFVHAVLTRLEGRGPDEPLPAA
jgi:hypothetical protein